MRESGSFAFFVEVRRSFIPVILAQNLFLRFAFFEFGSSFDGLVVTAIESFDPGFSRRYEAIPLRFNPPSGSLPSFLCHAAVFASATYPSKESCLSSKESIASLSFSIRPVFRSTLNVIFSMLYSPFC